MGATDQAVVTHKVLAGLLPGAYTVHVVASGTPPAPMHHVAVKGGPGSGNFAHAGRPGHVGGSASGNGSEHTSAPGPKVLDMGKDRLYVVEDGERLPPEVFTKPATMIVAPERIYWATGYQYHGGISQRAGIKPSEYDKSARVRLESDSETDSTALHLIVYSDESGMDPHDPHGEWSDAVAERKLKRALYRLHENGMALTTPVDWVHLKGASSHGYLADWLPQGTKGGAGSGNFGHAGRPGKRGGSAAGNGAVHSAAPERLGRTEPQTKEEHGLHEYLQMISGLQAQHGAPARPHEHASFEAMVLKNGRFFTPAPRPKDIKAGKPKLCFMNAYKLAEAHPEYTYVEGYAFPDLALDMGIDHAWCVDATGRVIDNTWPKPGRSYFGVALATDYVREQALRNRVYGVFGGMSVGARDILRNGVPRPALKGGPGSGNFAHAGRPGKVGGSAPAGGGAVAHQGEDRVNPMAVQMAAARRKFEGGLSPGALRLKVTATNPKFLARYDNGVGGYYEVCCRQVATAFHKEQKAQDELDTKAATMTRHEWADKIGHIAPLTKITDWAGGEEIGMNPITRQEAIIVNGWRAELEHTNEGHDEPVYSQDYLDRYYPHVTAGDAVNYTQRDYIHDSWMEKRLDDHKALVAKALAAGQRVKPEVLADYPDLADQYPQPKIMPPAVRPRLVADDPGITTEALKRAQDYLDGLPTWAVRTVPQVTLHDHPGNVFIIRQPQADGTTKDQTYRSGGHWDKVNGEVVVFNQESATHPMYVDVGSILPHEVGHAVYDAMLDRASEEKTSRNLQKVSGLIDAYLGFTDVPGILRTADERRQDVHQFIEAHRDEVTKHAPYLVAESDWDAAWDAGEDGITAYSKEWAASGRGHETETFAELVSYDIALPGGLDYVYGPEVVNEWGSRDAPILRNRAAVRELCRKANAPHLLAAYEQITALFQADEDRSNLARMDAAAAAALGQKGGPGSGNFGHAGRPGKVGGSASGSEAEHTAPPETDDFGTHQVDAETFPMAPTGLRPGWENIRHSLSSAMQHTFLMDLREWAAKRIGIMDKLSQDEMVDIIDYQTSHIIWMLDLNDEDNPWDPAVGERLRAQQGIESHLEGVPQGGWDDWPRGAQYACRLDEAHAQELVERMWPQANNFKRLPDGTHDYGHGYSYGDDPTRAPQDVLKALQGFGPTAKFRQQLGERMVAAHIGLSVPLLTGDVDVDIKKVIGQWTTGGNMAGNLWLNAAAAQVFGGPRDLEGYWNDSSLGIILKDPSSEWLAVTKELYRRTQAFYAAKKKAPTEFTAYRGVAGDVQVAAPVESWSLQAATAQRFAKMMATRMHDGQVLTRQVPRKQILMSWEALKGVWPEESELKGKKEISVIGYDFDPEQVLQ